MAGRSNTVENSTSNFQQEKETLETEINVRLNHFVGIFRSVLCLCGSDVQASSGNIFVFPVTSEVLTSDIT